MLGNVFTSNPDCCGNYAAIGGEHDNSKDYGKLNFYVRDLSNGDYRYNYMCNKGYVDKNGFYIYDLYVKDLSVNTIKGYSLEHINTHVEITNAGQEIALSVEQSDDTKDIARFETSNSTSLILDSSGHVGINVNNINSNYNVDISGNTLFRNNVDLSNNLTITGDVVIEGQLTSASIVFQESDINFENNVKMMDASAQNLDVSKNLTVGNYIISKDLTVSNDTSLNNLSVTGDASMNLIYVNNDLTVGGNITANSTNSSQLFNFISCNNFTLDGSATIIGDLDVKGTFTSVSYTHLTLPTTPYV